MEEVKEKPKSLIDRFWWVIPPVFLMFVYWPLIIFILEGTYSLEKWLRDLNSFLVIGDSGFYAIFMFGVMGLGYILTLNRSLKIRIIIPSLLGTIGLWVGFVIGLMISPSA